MSSVESERIIGNLKKRRGSTRGSITRLGKRMKELEDDPEAPGVHDHARQSLRKLENMDSDFKTLHWEIIDLIDTGDETELEREQDVLDKHDDCIASLTFRIQQLLTNADPQVRAGNGERSSAMKLNRMERGLKATETALELLDDSHDEIPLLEQHQEQLADFRGELAGLHEELVHLNLRDDHDLIVLHAQLEKIRFDCAHHARKLIHTHTARNSTSTACDRGSKLPRLDVPVFNGDVLNWQPFWEQFSVSVHQRTSLANSEKLVYLQQAVKTGPARSVIEGLSRSGDQYQEAIDCLMGRYNRPRQIHRAHVRKIVDAPPLKDGGGKELRRLHDTLQQHLRALNTMSHGPDPSFITSVIELKFDSATMFEWQRHSQEKVMDIPHYQDILNFLDLRAQASETSLQTKKEATCATYGKKTFPTGKSVTSFATTTDSNGNSCILCHSERHPLYACQKFKALSYDDKRSVLKRNHICFNCLRGGHFLNQCESSHRCKRCQKLHHTLLHVDPHGGDKLPFRTPDSPTNIQPQVISSTAVKLKSSTLLMTSKVLVSSPDGCTVEARALLDSASSASFISERLVQGLRMPRSHQPIKVSGITGLVPIFPTQSVASFNISPICSGGRKLDVTAVVVPKVTSDLPVYPVPFNLTWTHLQGLSLADPSFGQPGRIDVLLGVDIFVDVLRQGRRIGPPGSPSAIETELGWVLSGTTDPSFQSQQANMHVTVHHATATRSDDLLRRFWEIEEPPMSDLVLTPDEREVLCHFKEKHTRSADGRFIVPLPKCPDPKPFGESRAQAVRRFHSLERSLHQKNQFQTVNTVIQEYLDLGHAEPVPAQDMNKDVSKVFYLPMHVVHKASSTTTKVRAVFDASAKSTTGVSLNDTLMVGPTVHSQLIDVLLRFRTHRIALTADVSKMYRAIELVSADRELHRFVWRKDLLEPLRDFRMTRATFGVSASCFAANMAVKQNATDLAHKYPLAAQVVDKSFYVDDGLTGADDINATVVLRNQLQELFMCGGFNLRKWNSSEPSVLEQIPPDLREEKEILSISGADSSYTKTLGVKWDTISDSFHVAICEPPSLEHVTKRNLSSDIAKVFDALGWFSPATICMKILLQRTWEASIEWDDQVPEEILDLWRKWRLELKLLSEKAIPRCYYPKQVRIISSELHGFSDASEDAYAGVVYLRMVDSEGTIHMSLVESKTKVSPIKRLSIPRLELCGAVIISRLLHHAQGILNVPPSNVHAWTDSTIVLSWLVGNPRRFKTYVGNRISEVIDKYPAKHWRHVPSADNPADCASRGLLPSELLDHQLWWNGPPWLSQDESQWPPPQNLNTKSSSEESEVCLIMITQPTQLVIPLKQFSSLGKVVRVVAWIMRFVKRCRRVGKMPSELPDATCLTVSELSSAEQYLVKFVQSEQFCNIITSLKNRASLPSKCSLLSLFPFIDSKDVLRVGGRNQNSRADYDKKHPIILPGTHAFTRLIIRSEHLRLLHAGPSLVFSSLARRYHIIGAKRTIRSVVRQCTVCRRYSTRPEPPLVGQLPKERVTPGNIFDRVGVDYAGPFQVKYGHVRKPTLVKAYLCIFVSLEVKAVHLEAVSDLTTAAFVGTLRRFIARRGNPSLILSDNGTNFVGAEKELRELYHFLSRQEVNQAIVNSCSSKGIEWRFIPERSPHFGGLWEAAVKSTKAHLRKIVGPVKLTFEELSTVLAQIEACLNSRPLVALQSPDDDGMEALTPGHFLIGRPLCALPDQPSAHRPLSLLRRWQLCQNLTQHFWQRWSEDYLVSLNRFNKWQRPKKNLEVGDVVVLREGGLTTNEWPLARVEEVYRGRDGIVRVARIRTARGTYKRPVVKLAPLLSSN